MSNRQMPSTIISYYNWFMRGFAVILIAVSLFCFVSCADKYGEFQTAESGLQYRIVDNNRNTGKSPKIGDVLELNYSYETEDGRVLFDSHGGDRKYMKTLEAPAHTGGSVEDGLAMLHEGDSALFKISAENFLLFSEKYGHLPEGIKSLDPIIIKVRLVDIMDDNEIDRYMSSRYHKSETQESEILESFLKNTNVTVEPTPSGLYFLEKTPGEGKTIENGDIVTLNYTLTLVDGSLVETTLGRDPMTYRVGDGGYIAGWSEAILMMKKGMSATVIVPSELGYGAEGKGNILPYSTLVFDIEILNVQ